MTRFHPGPHGFGDLLAEQLLHRTLQVARGEEVAREVSGADALAIVLEECWHEAALYTGQHRGFVEACVVHRDQAVAHVLIELEVLWATNVELTPILKDAEH